MANNLRRFFWAVIFCAALATASMAAETFEIVNNTASELVDIFVKPKSEPEFFMRLDLQPHKNADFENPALLASIRIDTGFELIAYSEINFAEIDKLTLDADFAIRLDGPNVHMIKMPEHVINLVPQNGDTPVCELSSFKPRMPMTEVCRIVPEEAPRDDNGALLAGLGFGGLAWAGRLAPEQEVADGKDVLLEHMELRRPFSKDDLMILLKHMETRHYVPWQCEFPKANLDFADMPDKKQGDRDKALLSALTRYLQVPQGKRGEATIMLAPEATLASLANADEPETDVQLYTLVLKPDSNMLMVDVAAYEGQKKERKPLH